MNDSTSFRSVLGYLPEKMRGLMSAVSESELHGLTEVRMRAGGPVYLVYPDRIRFLLKTGGLSLRYSDDTYIVGTAAVRDIIERLCRFSVHSCGKQLSEGYFVIENGVRVGISGVYTSADVPMLHEFVSLNFRIPRCVRGCADKLFEDTFDSNIIICGGVNSGKTTVLRELCRLTGNCRKAVLIDERNEVSCTLSGEPQNDVGAMTDVIVNMKRSCGIISAVRTLSPEVIFCDEISSMEDAKAVLDGIGCGVKFVVTAHGSSISELRKREDTAFLMDSGMIDRIVFLQGQSAPSKIREIKRYSNVY